MPPKYTMSDSESEAEAPVPSGPSDQAQENSLRETVTEIFKSGNMDDLTVKRVRLAAEAKLGLPAGHFKSTGVWKMRSEEIIKDEVEIQDQAAQSSPAKPTRKSPSPPPKTKPTALPKRAKTDSVPRPSKRQKTEPPVAEEDNELSVASGDGSDEVTKPKKRTKAPAKRSPVKKAPIKKTKDIVSDTSDVSDDDSNAAKLPTEGIEMSDSEMSVVLDEEPKSKAPRKRQNSAAGAPPKTKKGSKAKDEDISPDQAEIKRLQGWLIKCGIRKLWGKELAPYDTPKAKIKHLKGMLEDAGMTGRPSQEKANQIREERELKADLEMIQQGAKQWGANSDEEQDGDAAKPRRRLSRAQQSLAFLESDGEETD